MTLAREDGRVDAGISASDDGFASVRMCARLVFGDAPTARSAHSEDGGDDDVDAAPLYGPLLFHGGRFRRLDRYRVVTARRIVATIRPDDGRPWHGEFEPQHLVLGDPGARDAMLHCLQAAVPHRRVLPVAVERVIRHRTTPPARVEAREVEATADRFTFDIASWDAAGHMVEEWHGATFRAVDRLEAATVLTAAPGCAGAYCERVVRAALAAAVEIALVHRPDLTQAERRRRALRLLGLEGSVSRRADGRPILLGHPSCRHLSLAHRDGITVAVVSADPVGCDVERAGDWSGPDAPAVLPPRGRALVDAIAGERPDVAAARVWTVAETHRKQGLAQDFTACKAGAADDGVVVFESPHCRTVTIHVPVLDVILAVGTNSFRGDATDADPERAVAAAAK